MEFAPIIKKLPAVAIDHLGLSQDELSQLLQLLHKGAKVKAARFGRIDGDLEEMIRSLHRVNPTALMFGTDLPSTRARRPFDPADIH